MKRDVPSKIIRFNFLPSKTNSDLRKPHCREMVGGVGVRWGRAGGWEQ